MFACITGAQTVRRRNWKLCVSVIYRLFRDMNIFCWKEIFSKMKKKNKIPKLDVDQQGLLLIVSFL